MKIDYWEIIKGLWQVFLLLWPVLVVLLVGFAIKIFFKLLGRKLEDWRIRRKFKKGESWRSDRELLHWLRGMRPSEFEDYISDLFRRLGYKTEATGGSHDGGVDVIAEKDGIKHYIQCKKFIIQAAGVGAIRDFYGALADHLAKGKGYFITTNKFTLEAQKFAEDKPIELIDGFRLVEYIRLAEKDDKPGETPAAGQPCPKCGGKLTERTGKFGAFYGCENYPKCTYAIKK